MKISLTSVIDKIEAQKKRIEANHAFAANPLEQDIKIVKLNCEVMKDYDYPADQPDVQRYCICIIPSGTFIDPDRAKLRGGGFLLPCVDAMLPTMTHEEIEARLAPARARYKAQLAEGKSSDGGSGVSQAEIAAARAEAVALREKELKADAYGVPDAAGKAKALQERLVAQHHFGMSSNEWWDR